jgi:hypothetical protein
MKGMTGFILVSGTILALSKVIERGLLFGTFVKTFCCEKKHCIISHIIYFGQFIGTG